MRAADVHIEISSSSHLHDSKSALNINFQAFTATPEF
jgi:hypothetical protein